MKITITASSDNKTKLRDLSYKLGLTKRYEKMALSIDAARARVAKLEAKKKAVKGEAAKARLTVAIQAQRDAVKKLVEKRKALNELRQTNKNSEQLAEAINKVKGESKKPLKKRPRVAQPEKFDIALMKKLSDKGLKTLQRKLEKIERAGSLDDKDAKVYKAVKREIAKRATVK